MRSSSVKGTPTSLSSSVDTLGLRVRDAAMQLVSLMSIVTLEFQNGRGGIQHQVNIITVMGIKARVTVRVP